MKTFALLPTFLLISSPFVLAESQASPETLTPAEADAIVETEMMAKAEREAEVRARLESVPAFEVFTVREGDHRIIMRRVAPQTTDVAQPEGDELDETEPTGEEQPRLAGDGKTREALSPVFITVYGDHVSLIDWRGYQVWSSVSLAALPPFGDIEESEAIYSWFAIVTESDDTSSLPDLGFSPDGPPEYLVYADEESDVPDALFREMDLLHHHYLANEEQLRAERQRAKTLEAARIRYREANPEAPRETLINYSPISSRTQ